MEVRTGYLTLLLCAAGCQEPAPDAEIVAAKVLADREQREKDDLAREPNRYLELSGLVYEDEGIVNDYRQLTAITVLNKSKHAVTDVVGEVAWYRGKEKLGAVPFQLDGSIAGGDTKAFSAEAKTLKSGTLKGNADRAGVVIKTLRVVEP